MASLVRSLEVALLFCRVRLQGEKPKDKAYPKEVTTIGGAIRSRRLDLGLHRAANQERGDNLRETPISTPPEHVSEAIRYRTSDRSLGQTRETAPFCRLVQAAHCTLWIWP
jgi:hypothetical protein